MTSPAGEADRTIPNLDPAARPATRVPWLLVVARGRAGLLAEVESLFRSDPRVRVIEDRRRGRSLLPRDTAVPRPEVAPG